VAFLRAINVGGHVVKMEQLRALFEAMKFERVETFLASGNVVFEHAGFDGAGFDNAANSAESDLELAARIEARLLKALGYAVSTFVRTDAEIARIAGQRPFAAAAMKTAATFCVGMLGAAPAADVERRLMALQSAEDDFRVLGRELYWLGQKNQGKAVISNAVLEKALGMRTTLRGMNTMQRLAAKYPAG
jgi:uncharacterized protein (DUF1697 family)